MSYFALAENQRCGFLHPSIMLILYQIRCRVDTYASLNCFLVLFVNVPHVQVNKS